MLRASMKPVLMPLAFMVKQMIVDERSSPFEMMKSFGISYKSAAENIAKGQATAQAVVNAWMNSSGHRKNILSSSYTHIGVGYVANGNYWTQMFIGK